ncbi:uncharacterized protein LOC125197908 [Salvia hispanica]|uniref:uncharacterized protein LOC125197908 n=1 Tax=Salvia hispanica TaxID=49212 RepID=UPI0020093C32|nr:uncharacterized protein LOC125197908 [Salvia hispanica]
MSPAEKPPKFGGCWTKWYQKMLFYLTTLHVAKFLAENGPPAPSDQETRLEIMADYEAWRKGDYLCKNFTLSALDDSLYNVYSVLTTSKEMWENLEKKYSIDNVAGTEHVVVSKFMDYKMVDSRPVMEQVQEFQMIIHGLVLEGMTLPDNFVRCILIEKLPPSWKDFKLYLKHKRKRMTLEDLIVKLRIEADVRKSDQKVKVHLRPKPTCWSGTVPPTNGLAQIRRTKGMGNSLQRNLKASAKEVWQNLATLPKTVVARRRSLENEFKDWDEGDLVVVVTEEVNLLDNKGGWYIDTGVTAHVCSNRSKFASYILVEGRKINMGNQALSDVLGIRNVILMMTSGVTITLKVVLHVPDIRKNLVSRSILVNRGFKLVFESDRLCNRLTFQA